MTDYVNSPDRLDGVIADLRDIRLWIEQGTLMRESDGAAGGVLEEAVDSLTDAIYKLGLVRGDIRERTGE